MKYTLLFFTSAIAAASIIDCGDESALRGHAANLLRLSRARGDKPEHLHNHEFRFSNGTRIALKLLTDAEIDALTRREARAVAAQAVPTNLLTFPAAA